MSHKKLEERVAVLEKQVQLLLSRHSGKPRSKEWQRTLGMFSGNELMKELDAECLARRERERRKARAPKRKRPGVRV